MKFWVIAVIIGAGLLLVSTKDGRPPDTVTCDNQTMGPGDVCKQTTNGHTTSVRTYEEMKSSQEASAARFRSWGRWAFLGGGLVLVLGGVTGIVLTRRRRRNAVAPQPVVWDAQRRQQYVQQQYLQQHGYPPQQYPQQPPMPQYPPPQAPPYPPQSFGPRH